MQGKQTFIEDVAHTASRVRVQTDLQHEDTLYPDRLLSNAGRLSYTAVPP